jgi:phosphoserine aminotransferase
VLRQAAEEIFSYGSSGIGVMELSHRSPEFEGIIASAESLLRELLSIPKNYKVLFMTGGATNQFSCLPMNLCNGGVANYLLSGFWSERAFNEAKKFAPVYVAASTKDIEYRSVPRTFKLSDNPAYLHFTTNNTIFGTQYRQYPLCQVPLIGDASSDILSRPVDIGSFGVYYAAAQKNAGVAGVTLVIIREDLLDRVSSELPVMMSYKVAAENNSLFNTAPTLPIYLTMRVLEWIKREGGVAEMERRAHERAQLLYDCLDRHEVFVPFAAPDSRSLMNITFHLKDPALTEQLISKAEECGISGIKGYRTMGGLRVSMYNAMPLDSVRALVDFLETFARTS